MRLTLRTLLSYLDNVLEEPARTALEQQIEASEHAKEWVHRTRDVMRRLKLGAPEPGGSGTIDDPNTVAEYLDRELPEAEVAEFERVCLESDALLAEVASCHQVLAKVLSEPVEIDPDTRARLYALPETLARAEAAGPAPAPQPVAAPFDGRAVPVDVAPQPRRRLKHRTAAAVDAEDAPVGFNWAAWGPPMAALALLAVTIFFLSPPSPEAVTKVDPPESGEPKVDTVTDDQPDVVDGAPDPEAGEPTVDPAPAPIASNEPNQPETGNVAGAAPSEEAQQPKLDESATTLPVESDKAPVVEPTPPATVDEQPAAEEASGDETAMAADQPATEEPKAEPKPQPDPESEPAPRVLFAGDVNSVVAVEAPDQSWQLLRPGASTEQLAHVISLPPSRGLFRLDNGALVEVVGQTEARIDPASATIELVYGRLIVSNLAEAKAPVELVVVLDGVPHAATLGPGAAIAIAADRFYEPGRNVLAEAAPLSYVASALGGEVSWETDGSSLKLSQEKPAFEEVNLRVAPEGFESVEWVRELKLPLVDAEAWPRLGASIRAGGSLATNLAMAAAPQNLEEDRSLAARCLLALGDAEPVAASFDDDAFEKFWPAHLAELRSSASRGTASAERVFVAFTQKYDRGNGSILFDLLQGFPPAEVGADPGEVAAGLVSERLMPMLESLKLADRVLGKLVLVEVAQLPAAEEFDPAGSSRTRRSALVKIRRQLAPSR